MGQRWKRETHVIKKQRTPNGWTNQELIRLSGQTSIVFDVMEYAHKNNMWLLLDEICVLCDKVRGFECSQPASVSATLRTLRNKYGLEIDKRLRDGIAGLYEYRLRYTTIQGD